MQQRPLFFVEELTPDLLHKFASQVLSPYVKNLFEDLLLRSPQCMLLKYKHTPQLDRLTLI